MGFCAHPIHLTGSDECGRQQVVWVRCNNRRADVCPSLSDLYARDTWQLVHAGTSGGHHGIPATIASRPQVFVTLTAPSYGPVHTGPTAPSVSGRVCRDHKRIGGYRRCRHGNRCGAAQPMRTATSGWGSRCALSATTIAGMCCSRGIYRILSLVILISFIATIIASYYAVFVAAQRVGSTRHVQQTTTIT